MERKKIIFEGYHPIEHIDVNAELGIGDIVDDAIEYVRKSCIQSVKAFDEKLIDEILRVARENNVTDLWLIDEEFVITAMKNEIKRRRRKAWWKKLWKRD